MEYRITEAHDGKLLRQFLQADLRLSSKEIKHIKFCVRIIFHDLLPEHNVSFRSLCILYQIFTPFSKAFLHKLNNQIKGLKS